MSGKQRRGGEGHYSRERSVALLSPAHGTQFVTMAASSQYAADQVRPRSYLCAISQHQAHGARPPSAGPL